MEITKYVYEDLTGFGFNWHPVTDDGEILVYPCGDLKGVKEFVAEYKDLLEIQHNSDDNYGLAFYECGYNGQAQQEFIESWAEIGVAIF
jgi:gp17